MRREAVEPHQSSKRRSKIDVAVRPSDVPQSMYAISPEVKYSITSIPIKRTWLQAVTGETVLPKALNFSQNCGARHCRVSFRLSLPLHNTQTHQLSQTHRLTSSFCSHRFLDSNRITNTHFHHGRQRCAGGFSSSFCPASPTSHSIDCRHASRARKYQNLLAAPLSDRS